jgi:hypothetical protein
MDRNGDKEKELRETLELIEFLRKGRKLDNDPFLRAKVDKALRGKPESLLRHFREHPDIIEKAKTNLYVDTLLKEKNPFYPPPYTKEEVAILSGPLELGYHNPNRNVFGINPHLLNLNAMVVGKTRSGKSNLNLMALDHLLTTADSFNIIIIDLKKEYRCLLPTHPNLKIITLKNLRYNPLEVPEWEDPKEHINNVAEVFCKENYILSFGKNMFINKVEYLYNVRGVFEGKKSYPTFRDLYNQVKTIKSFGREADSRATLISRLQSYVDYPEVFCGRSFPFATWLNNHLVIELENITNEMYATITNFIVSSIYHYYQEKNLRGSQIRTLFVVDEAGVLFNAMRDRDFQFGDSYINTLVRRGGEFGLGFWVTSQEPNTISQSIHSNSFLKFMFPLVEGNQLAAMAASMALTEQQSLFSFKLPTAGMCIVRYGLYPNPFLLEVPLFPGEKAVSDAFVEEKMRDFYKEITPKQEPVKDEIKKEPEQKIPEDKIPVDALILLKHIADHPFDNYTTHRNTCSLEKHKVEKARDWLLDKGYLARVYIKTTKGKSAPSCYLVLEEKALNCLNIEQHFGKGSFKHQLYCHLIQSKLEKEGWKAKIEGNVCHSTKLIDVVAEKDSDIVGYEVTLHFENLLENIAKDFEAVNHLIIVVEKNDLEKAGAEIKKYQSTLNPNEYLQVKSIEDFF